MALTEFRIWASERTLWVGGSPPLTGLRPLLEAIETVSA